MKMKRNNLFFPSFDIESSWNRSDCVRFFTVLYTVLRTRNSSAESEIKNGWFIWSIFLEIKGERERVCTLHRFQLGDWSVESMPIPSNVCSVRALDYSTRLKSTTTIDYKFARGYFLSIVDLRRIEWRIQHGSSTCSYTRLLFEDYYEDVEVIIDSKIKRFRSMIRVITQRGCVCVNSWKFFYSERSGRRMDGVKIWKERKRGGGGGEKRRRKERRREKEKERNPRSEKSEINVSVVDFSWRRIVHKFEAKPKFSAFRDSAIKNMNIHNAVVR